MTEGYTCGNCGTVYKYYGHGVYVCPRCGNVLIERDRDKELPKDEPYRDRRYG
jgi:predicted RNA-binding Zn-ribbon protein involved in translation (DUF1610 family)